ncbi:MAG: PBP1A family penicillin-binding protein, partial [Chloroflexia bacterium]
RSRVGNVRALAAARRHGSGGATGVIARLMVLLFILSFVLTTAGFGAGFAGAGYYVSQLPPVGPEYLSQAIADHGILAQTTKIYDRNGVPLYDFVDEETGLHEELNIDEIAPLVISATIAAEDATFWTNPGVDPLAIVRAVRINLSGDGSSGASTITQQLARNIFMSLEERTEQSYSRKLKEQAIAIQMTRTYSKEYIMELYLNQTYYGHRAYGVGAAARTYFGKKANELNLAESALIAGLAQSPHQDDPYTNMEGALERQKYTLEQMVKLEMITEAEEQSALSYPIADNLKGDDPSIKAPHFVYYVKEYLEKTYGPAIANAGLEVHTTLDLSVQDTAERVARDRIDEIRKQKATNAAMVVMKPNTGEILAMVGSVNYYDTTIDGQVNVATRPRQPGSSFKPITFANAFRKGWSPATVLLDTLTGFSNPGQKDYAPKNYDGKDHGWVTVREALANSYNIPAVKAIQFAGVQDTIDFAREIGLKSKESLIYDSGFYGLSLTLGGGEVTLLDMTNAYSTFANNGRVIDANPIRKIIDAQGRTIYQLDENPPGDQVLDPRIAYMITSILSDNRARTPMFGANSALKLSVPAAGKTGTTDDNRDSWTLGYTPNLTVGVWVGNNNNSEMAKVTGAVGAATIWHNFMEEFYKNESFVNLVERPDGKLQRDFIEPDGLIKKWACSEKGDVQDYFLEETPPKGCTTYRDKNKQLRSAPSTNRNPNPNPNQQPRARPTPMPGIIYPTPVP